jgi:predicted DNA-binding transcriptional regulator AlpA
MKDKREKQNQVIMDMYLACHSQEEIAAALGYSEKAIYNWVRGSKIPKYISLACSAYLFDLPPYGARNNKS